jgi:hypothetical protein
MEKDFNIALKELLALTGFIIIPVALIGLIVKDFIVTIQHKNNQKQESNSIPPHTKVL